MDDNSKIKDQVGDLLILTGHRRERLIFGGMKRFTVFMTAFALLQGLSFRFLGNEHILNKAMAEISVIANLCLALASAVFLFANLYLFRNSQNRDRLLEKSLHGFFIATIIIWLVHIYLAGSQSTLLALLLPTTASIIMMIMGTKWGWFYWLAATLGYLAIGLLEMMEVLPYFPLIPIGDEFFQVFHNFQYLGMNFTLYLISSMVPLLVLSRMISMLRKRTWELVEAKDEMERLATQDSLTGLLVRRAIQPRFEKEMIRADRTGNPLCVIMIDVDDFKKVNDDYGHAVGDEVLRTIARVLTQSFRQYDLIARIGGEEFMVVLPENDLESGRRLAERTRAQIEATSVMIPGRQAVRFTASFGLALYLPGETATLDEMMHRSDMALYRSKKSGKNRVTAALAG